MAEEKTAAPAAAPKEVAPAKPAVAPAQGGQGAKKGSGSKVCLILAIIFIVIVIILGVGGYLFYRYAKNKVKNAAEEITTSTTSTTTSTTGNSTTASYDEAKDLTPSTAFGKEINTQANKILAQLFGGAKLRTYTGSGETDIYLDYVTKNQIKTEDSAKIEAAYVAEGYTKDTNNTTSDGFIIYLTKGNISLQVATYYSYENNTVSVTATKTTD